MKRKQKPTARPTPVAPARGVHPLWIVAALLGGMAVTGLGVGGYHVAKVIPWHVTPSGPSITDKGYGCLIIQETQDRQDYTTAQINAMDSMAEGGLRAYITGHGGIWRVLDKDDPVDQDLPVVQNAWKLERKSVPWLVIWRDKRCYSGPLESDTAALELAKTYGKGL